MTNDEIIERARAWWRELQEAPGAASSLRRCRSPREALLLPQTLSLIRRLGARDGRVERIAALAVVLAHVKEDDRRPLMRAAGDTRFGKEDAVVSRPRFRRLISARDTEELLTNLTRLVAILGGAANVGDLATSLYWWTDRTRADWAATYYAADINDTEKDTANA